MSMDAWPQLQLEATWAIVNIASGTTEQCSEIVLNEGIPKLMKLLKHPIALVTEQAVWALGNIALDCTLYRDLILREGAI
jgi:hypothetical protein